MNNQEFLPKNRTFLTVTIIATAVIIGSWIATILILQGWSNEDKSAFGDMFGATNTLFSGLALAGIILTILLQRNELALQRQELKDTREELRRTAIAQENSEKALSRQAENLKISAKLSALSTLVSFYSDVELNIRKGIPSAKIELSQAIQQKLESVRRIEEILESKEI